MEFFLVGHCDICQQHGYFICACKGGDCSVCNLVNERDLLKDSTLLLNSYLEKKGVKWMGKCSLSKGSMDRFRENMAHILPSVDLYVRAFAEKYIKGTFAEPFQVVCGGSWYVTDVPRRIDTMETDDSIDIMTHVPEKDLRADELDRVSGEVLAIGLVEIYLDAPPGVAVQRDPAEIWISIDHLVNELSMWPEHWDLYTQIYWELGDFVMDNYLKFSLPVLTPFRTPRRLPPNYQQNNRLDFTQIHSVRVDPPFNSWQQGDRTDISQSLRTSQKTKQHHRKKALPKEKTLEQKQKETQDFFGALFSKDEFSNPNCIYPLFHS